MTDGRVGKQLQGGIILDVIMFDDAAVTVNRVFTQAYVGDQKKVTNVLAYCTKRLLNDAILVVGVGRQIILLLGNPK